METIVLDIVLLQETMGKRDQVIKEFISLFQGWSFEVVNANGISRGLAMGWSLRKCRCDNMWSLDLELDS